MWVGMVDVRGEGVERGGGGLRMYLRMGWVFGQESQVGK